MTPTQGILLIIFGIVGFMIVTDKNVGVYLTLIFQIIKMDIQKFIWKVRLHPKNPITNLMMKIKYERIAKELQKELQ